MQRFVDAGFCISSLSFSDSNAINYIQNEIHYGDQHRVKYILSVLLGCLGFLLFLLLFTGIW